MLDNDYYLYITPVEFDVYGPGFVARTLGRMRKPNPLNPFGQLQLSPRLCTSPLVLSLDYRLELLGECIRQLRLHDKVP